MSMDYIVFGLYIFGSLCFLVGSSLALLAKAGVL